MHRTNRETKHAQQADPQAASRPTQRTNAPNEKIQLELLSDIGPELVQRWTETQTAVRPNSKVNPVMYRALLSTVLRAPSFGEADDFMASYRRMAAAASDTPGCLLGFAIADTPSVRTSVLHDVLVSAARDEALLPTGDALRFYNSAGAGTGDEDEYDKAVVDQRVEFCESKDSLEEVRQYALALVVDAFANALAQGRSGTVVKECIDRYHINGFVGPYVDTFANHVHRVGERTAKALHKFYAAYYAQSNEATRMDFRTRLLQRVMQLAVERPDNVLPFVYGISDVGLRCSVCRICLVQRFDVDDPVEGTPLTAKLLTRAYLHVRLVAGRKNKVVPALLAGLLSGWFSLCTEADLKTPMNKVNALLDSLKKIRRRNWAAFGGPPGDVTALQICLMRLGQQVWMASVDE